MYGMPGANHTCTDCLCAAELTPPRAARPKTTTAVARRLISNALGNSQVRGLLIDSDDIPSRWAQLLT